MFMRSSENFRRSSSNEKSSELRRNHEDLRRTRFEQFQLKYLKKEKISLDKQNEYRNKLKERAIKADKRRTEAILKRNALYEEKKNKTFARKSRSEDRNANTNSSVEFRASSTPGVFINFSRNNQAGTSGFGNAIERGAEYITTKLGVNFVNTSVYDKRYSERRLDICFNRSCRSLNQLESNMSSEGSEIRTSVSPESHYISSIVEKKDEDTSTSNVISPTPYPKKWKCIDKNRTYRSIRRKRVSFVAPKSDQTFAKPTIKKSLVIETPETKKGILLKMSTLSSKQKINEHLKYEPGMLLRVSLPSKCDNEEFVEVSEDDLLLKIAVEADRVLINEATNTESTKSSYPIHSITTSFRNQELTQEINCEMLFQTCEIDQMNRKLKLAQLHENLIKIENETKKITEKNSEISKKFINKFQIFKENVKEKSMSEDSFGDSRSKIITNNLQSALSAIRPINNSQKKNYYCNKKLKQYRLMNGTMNLCNFGTYKTAANIAMEDLRL